MDTTASGGWAFLAVVSCGKSAEAWPIEVAWCFAEGPTRSMLITPAPGWALTAWDKTSEGAHRLELETLLKLGKEPLDAALVLNAALGQSRVLSSAPKTDSYWLYKLYNAAAVTPNFQLDPRVLNVETDGRRADAMASALRRAFQEQSAS